VAQGAAFAEITAAVRAEAPPAAPYPVAVGRAAARQALPLRPLALLFLQGFAANLASACVRLVPLGQTDGQRVIAALRPLCERVADVALDAGLDDIGGCAFRADIAAMRHETQPVRLFRT
jgi:urease accessory protein